MADTPTAWRSSHTGQQIDTAVGKVSDSTLNSSKEGHIITLDSSGNLKASNNTLTEIETLKSDVTRIDSAQSNLEGEMEFLEGNFAEASGRVNILNNRVDSLEDFKTNQLIENQDIQDSFNDIGDSINGVYDQIDDLKNKNAEIFGKVEILDNLVNTLEDRIADQAENLRLFGIGLANVSRDMTDIKERVSMLEAQTLPDEVLVIYENDENTE